MRKEKQRFERSIRTKEDKIDEQDKTIHRMEKVIKMLQQDLADRKSREDVSAFPLSPPLIPAPPRPILRLLEEFVAKTDVSFFVKKIISNFQKLSR